VPDVVSPLTGVVVSVNVAVGDHVRAGQTVAVLESMKMEHIVEADTDGVVTAITAKPGDNLSPGEPLVSIDPSVLFSPDRKYQTVGTQER
jgi:biotin carboxyl carrier protein